MKLNFRRCLGHAFGAVCFKHLSENFRIKRAAVHTDSHRLFIAKRHLNHAGEVFHSPLAFTDVAGIDAIFGKRLGALAHFS